jgi:plasmid stabilization system protein ParE
MTYRLVVRRIAQEEFDDAFDWYEKQRAGLGVQFAEQVQAAFRQISRQPEIHPPVIRDIRRARIARFPYTLIYRVRGDRVIVLGVFHDRRDPKRWQGRN